jgi:HPt (histidine-containing phosphotransfer) domain-containing protein
MTTAPDLLPELASHAVLDVAALREITEAVGMTPMELIDMFIDDAAQTLASMTPALANGERELICRGAHSMKSSAGSTGAMQIAYIAKVLEHATRTELAAETGYVIAQLETTFTEFRAHVSERHAALSQ